MIQCIKEIFFYRKKLKVKDNCDSNLMKKKTILKCLLLSYERQKENVEQILMFVEILINSHFELRYDEYLSHDLCCLSFIK